MFSSPPYSIPFGASETNQTTYGFTGEPTDPNGLVYLRARYYNPSMGVFASLDPVEGKYQRPMNLNGYSWVEGNTLNRVDPTGNARDTWERLMYGSSEDTTVWR